MIKESRIDKINKEEILKKYFLDEFFNNNYYRDFRVLTENYKLNNVYKMKYDTKQQKTKILKDLEYLNNGKFNTYAELYGFKSWEDLKTHRINYRKKKNKQIENYNAPRYYDRIYFDLDIDEKTEPRLYPIAKELKGKILKAIYENDKETKQDLITKYHDLLNKGLAKIPYQEVQLFYKFLLDENIKSLTVFSGAKGFHLYIFFQPTLLNPLSFNAIATAYKDMFEKDLNIRTFDYKVFENPSDRIARVPYYKHNVTELYCYPVDINKSYNEIIKESFNPEIWNDFKITSHYNNQGNQNLLNDIKTLSIEEDKKQKKIAEQNQKIKELHKQRTIRKKKELAKKGINYKEIPKDCRTIANEFLGSPENDFGNKLLYVCPFHNDHKASLTVYEHSFVCYCLNENLNYLGFVMKYTGLNEKEAMKELLSRF